MPPAPRYLALVALVFCACSSGSEPAQSPAPLLDEACADHARAFCDQIERCMPSLLGLSYGDHGACVTWRSDECVFQHQTSSLTPASIQSCAQTMSSLDCPSFHGAFDRPMCTTPTGPLADGAGCVSGAECASGVCSRDSDESCGVCQAAPAPGESCMRSTDCPANHTCKAYRCVPANGPGQPCGPEQACSGLLMCRQNQCAPSASEDEACTASDCSNKLGLSCDPQSNTCKAIEAAAPGQPCGQIEGKVVFCAAAGMCKGYPQQAQGTCVEPVPEDRPCNVSSGPACIPPASCIDGWCRMPSCQ